MDDWRTSAIEVTDQGLRLERLDEPWRPEMPQSVADRFVNANECPQCQSELRRDHGRYCPTCGFRAERRIAFWPRVAADVAELAKRQREMLLSREDVQKLRWMYEGQQVPAGVTRADGMSDWERLRIILTDMPDEGYKLMPWAVREYKAGRISKENRRHAQDILEQATQWMVWAKEHNKPMPDYMSKQFGFAELEAWVYEMNAQNVDASDKWVDSTPVFEFEDGWHIDRVGPRDLGREGELMGHCVGGYCDTVSAGGTSIYSLRDPKGQPHVTVEIRGNEDLTKGYGEQEYTGRTINLVQEQGKQNASPLPEYKQRVDQWYDHLRDSGYEVTQAPDWENPEYERDDAERVFPNTLEGARQYHQALQNDDYDLHDDEDPREEIANGVVTQYYTEPSYVQGKWNWHSMEPIVQQAVTAANRGENAQELARTLFATAHHFDSPAGTDYRVSNDMHLVTLLGEEVEAWMAGRKPLEEKQPTLLTPEQNAELLGVPRNVKLLQEWVNAYAIANISHPNEVQLPGNGGWPTTSFPQHFEQLEANEQWAGPATLRMPGVLARTASGRQKWGDLDGLSDDQKKDVLTDRLLLTAGYDTDWHDPVDHDPTWNACPFCHNELDIQFHGGVDCPSCGAEFEMSAGGQLLPSDHTIEEGAKTWPDTLPWNEAEQDFYRTAGSEEFVQFFDEATGGGYAPATKPQTTFDHPELQAFQDEYGNHQGHFDTHIESSIPGYRELMTRKGMAIIKAFGPQATVLDLMGGEGSWAKTISAMGGNRTVTLDANARMNQFFNQQSQVPGAELAPYAYLHPFQDYDGTTYQPWQTQEQFDVVNESMGFQFVSNERASQIAEAKRLLKPGGLFMTDEKLKTPNYTQNEAVKDQWKQQFYTPDQLAEKNKVVNFQGDPATGMMGNMISVDEMETLLHGSFRYVQRYWESGNFIGYLASDDPSAIQRFLAAYGQPVQKAASGEWVPRLEPEYDGTEGRYPWVRVDGEILIGPDGGSHEQLERNHGFFISDQTRVEGLGEIHHNNRFSDGDKPWVRSFDSFGFTDDPDLERRVTETFLRAERMAGTWEDWMHLRRKTTSSL